MNIIAYNPTARTITFDRPVDLKKLKAVINAVTHRKLYLISSAQLTGELDFTNRILTIAGPLTGELSTHPLRIFYDEAPVNPTLSLDTTFGLGATTNRSLASSDLQTSWEINTDSGIYRLKPDTSPRAHLYAIDSSSGAEAEWYITNDVDDMITATFVRGNIIYALTAAGSLYKMDVSVGSPVSWTTIASGTLSAWGWSQMSGDATHLYLANTQSVIKVLIADGTFVVHDLSAIFPHPYSGFATPLDYITYIGAVNVGGTTKILASCAVHGEGFFNDYVIVEFNLASPVWTVLKTFPHANFLYPLCGWLSGLTSDALDTWNCSIQSTMNSWDGIPYVLSMKYVDGAWVLTENSQTLLNDVTHEPMPFVTLVWQQSTKAGSNNLASFIQWFSSDDGTYVEPQYMIGYLNGDLLLAAPKAPVLVLTEKLLNMSGASLADVLKLKYTFSSTDSFFCVTPGLVMPIPARYTSTTPTDYDTAGQRLPLNFVHVRIKPGDTATFNIKS